MTGRKPHPFLSCAVESSIPEDQAVIEHLIAERFAEDVLIPIEREEARKFIEGEGYPHEPRGILPVEKMVKHPYDLPPESLFPAPPPGYWWHNLVTKPAAELRDKLQKAAARKVRP